jgi:hypothetical protein
MEEYQTTLRVATARTWNGRMLALALDAQQVTVLAVGLVEISEQSAEKSKNEFRMTRRVCSANLFCCIVEFMGQVYWHKRMQERVECCTGQTETN